VVVHTANEVLLIKRGDQIDFWQSVTGTLRWGETDEEGAIRELQEETGITDVALRTTGIRRSFPIIEAWKSRYHPDTTRNLETLYYCPLAKRVDIQLNPAEHDDYQWLPFEQAMQTVYSWTNRLAITSLCGRN